MKKQFIVVTSQNVPKNKLQAILQEHLSVLDQTLLESFTEAKEAIKEQFKRGLNKYNGRAAVPDLKYFKVKEDTFSMYIEDVIYITVYQVKNRPN